MITTTSRPVLGQRSISRRGLLGGVAAVAAGAGLAACQPGSSARPGQQVAPSGDGGAAGYDGPPVELAFWNGLTGGDGPIMKKMCDNFTKEYPNVKISTTTIAWADYYQKLPAAVSNGKGPDVGMMHADTLATNAARQVVQPLDDVANALGMTEEDFTPIVWQAGMYNGQRYGLPLDLHPAGLYYNKRVMEKVGADPDSPPTNMDEFMNVLDMAKSKGVQGLWVPPGAVANNFGQTMVYQFGGHMVDEAGTTSGYNHPGTVAAMQWVRSLIDEGYSPKNAANDSDTLALQNDKTVFMFNGPWMVTPLKENKKVDWGVTQVPNIGGTLATWSGSHQFVLPVQRSADENKTKAARAFVNWIIQNSLAWADAGMVPARASVREMPEFAEKEEVNIFAQQLDYVRFLPPVPGISDIATEWATATSNIVAGKKGVQEALDEAAQKANRILAENQKKYQR
ncbi:extracellular solute-binding protein [Auraticoccus sp. F435]|uniref:Extracellular solute-binding protein n=1 Tax=Auraticoccus cholistanensis TaxID=2656650 RepID=A0A6A9UWQ6_9ACTN|nr:ABC transporter substrate-binding protein [Auraticoccus cholistanensis]MVA76095.1 extracellular solute-binding protein [Auraticoccus cholistanensis]